ncbi:hypothetical protein ACROYT_G000887 [Oculina patagonica]
MERKTQQPPKYGLRARFLVFCLRTGELYSNVMPSDETTSLLPEVNSLNWRRKCCKHFSWRGIFWIVYSLLLVTDVVVSIHYNLLNVSPCFLATNASNTKNTSDGTSESEKESAGVEISIPLPHRNKVVNGVVDDDSWNEVFADSCNADMQYARCIFSNERGGIPGFCEGLVRFSRRGDRNVAFTGFAGESFAFQSAAN